MDKFELQERTKKFAVRIYKMVEKLPNTRGTGIIANQIIRSSTCIAANYRAACRAKSKPEFINKLKIVEEETDETLFWLEFILDIELMKEKLLENLMNENKELLAIFTAAIKTSKNKS
jgi:four helix bundle protein